MAPEPQRIPFSALPQTNLTIDAIYEGGHAGNRGDDPLNHLLGVGNAGGFRVLGSVMKRTVKVAVLYSTGEDPDWPDALNQITGTFVYHGDQKTPGKELHDTPRKGNRFLRDIFELTAEGAEGRAAVPPLLLFEKSGRRGNDVIFRGVLAPGGPATRADEELVAAWRSRGGFRFQNYRATFTVLDIPTVTREWIDELRSGVANGSAAPKAWSDWVRSGVYRVVVTDPVLEYRTRDQQIPKNPRETKCLETVFNHFSSQPTAFEACAAKLWQMMAPSAEITEITRASVDGGRDAIGVYSIGPREDPIKLSFALEAKCYAPNNGVGTREVARLISRLKHREFGIFVTTSFVDRQAYQELRSDRHPVVVICGADIVRLLDDAGLGAIDSLRAWLAAEFPVS